MNAVKKHCSKCGTVKLLVEFWRDKTRLDGFDGWCKWCRKQNNNAKTLKSRREAYAKRNPERLLARRLARTKFGSPKKYKCSVLVCSLRAVSHHHVDYSKPLAVIPLCQEHHTDAHMDQGEL